MHKFEEKCDSDIFKYSYWLACAILLEMLFCRNNFIDYTTEEHGADMSLGVSVERFMKKLPFYRIAVNAFSLSLIKTLTDDKCLSAAYRNIPANTLY